MVKLLLDYGADASIKSDYGFTPGEQARNLGEPFLANLIDYESGTHSSYGSGFRKLVSGKFKKLLLTEFILFFSHSCHFPV